MYDGAALGALDGVPKTVRQPGPNEPFNHPKLKRSPADVPAKVVRLSCGAVFKVRVG